MTMAEIKVPIQVDLPDDWVEQIVNRLRNDPEAEWVEIVRCKDCKHSEFWYRDKRRCFLWHEEGIDVFEDGFCNYAERRTDEQTV